MKNKISRLPHALDSLESLSQILAAPRVALFTDFDGTLTPIFDNPQDTTLSPSIRTRPERVWPKNLALVAVISGRDATTLRRMIALDSLTYVGNHGLEVWKAGAERPKLHARIPDGLLEDIEKEVAAIAVPGLSVENKGLSVALHYRTPRTQRRPAPPCPES